MAIIALLNSKGGVGKSTLAAALAVRASKDHSVCLVDLDPQETIADWHERRGSPDNPALVTVDRVQDIREAVSGYDFAFLDGPPGSIRMTKEAVAVSDFAVLPTRASGIDLLASRDCVTLCREAGKPTLFVINDVVKTDVNTLGENAREALAKFKMASAKTMILHRHQHVNAMTTGHTGAEKDKHAAEEIDALWAEIKKAVKKGGRP